MAVARQIQYPQRSAGPVQAPSAVSETVTLDKWYKPTAQPTYPARRGQEGGARSGPLEPSLFRAPPALAWEPSYPDRVWSLPPRPGHHVFQGNPADFVVAEVVTLDKWYKPTGQPTYRARPPS